MQKLLAIFVLTILFSCKKDTPKLSPIEFSGSVKDSLSLEGIASVRIRMYWYGQNTGKETNVDSTETDTEGNYKINVTIDKSNFKTNVLIVEAVVPNAYISPLDINNYETGMGIYGIQSDKIRLLDLFLYQKAFLDIHLRKTSADSLREFDLHYGYQGPSFRNYWITSSIPTNDTTYRVITAAGMSTKIYWTKKTSSSAMSTFKDSIICLPNIDNIITLNY